MASLDLVSIVRDGRGRTIQLSRILIDGSDQGWGLQVLIRDPIAVQAGVPTSEYRLLNKAEMKNAMRELFDRAAEGLR
jgi:hypothetical protein